MASRPAPWRIAKTYEGHWAVWSVETLANGIRADTVVQRFGSFAAACKAFRDGGVQ